MFESYKKNESVLSLGTIGLCGLRPVVISGPCKPVFVHWDQLMKTIFVNTMLAEYNVYAVNSSTDYRVSSFPRLGSKTQLTNEYETCVV